MSIVLFAQIMVAGIALATAVLHLTLSFRHEAKALHATIALLSVSLAGEAASAALRYRAATSEVLVAAIRWDLTFQLLGAISFLWFVGLYTNRERGPVLKTLTAGLALVAILDLAAPFSILFQEAPRLTTKMLVWGEAITVPTGRRSLLLVVMNIVVFLGICYVLSSCFKVWKQGGSRKATRLALGLAPLCVVAYPQGLMVNWGLLNPPYLYSYGLLAVLWMMSYDLVTEAVQATVLSRKVIAAERRWQTLLENVDLMVAGADPSGVFTYVNPHFLKATGYRREEVEGRTLSDIIPEADFQRIAKGLEQPERHVTNRIRRKDGVLRTIHWSNVAMVDEQGVFAGVLGVGTDATDQEQAEAARDQAIRELEEARQRLEAENVYLKEEVFSGTNASEILGQSTSIRYVLHKIAEVAGTEATVLIEGETGVGKDLVARAIHRGSARVTKPFIRVNCAALPPTLAESELFGHEKGSFTGADKLRRGRFELADGGTLLLDEVGELPLDIQAKLLRVLQDGEYERVGGSETRNVDVRIIAATNRDLSKEVAAGRFREDLFYRLQVYPITVPPLHERREDIPLLVEHLTRRFAKEHGRTIKNVPGQVLRLLAAWDWPGNVRELENVIHRAVISSPGETLLLPRAFGTPQAQPTAPQSSIPPLEELERQHIQKVLEETRGKISGPRGAAELLQMHPNTLRSRLQKLGLGRTARQISS